MAEYSWLEIHRETYTYTHIQASINNTHSGSSCQRLKSETASEELLFYNECKKCCFSVPLECLPTASCTIDDEYATSMNMQHGCKKAMKGAS